MLRFLTSLLVLLLPGVALASTATAERLDLTGHWVGIFGLAVFVIAYMLVMSEEFTQLRKSKPVIIAAGLIWGTIAWVYVQHGLPHAAEVAARHNLLEYAELMLFLLVAMTYINSMEEHLIFDALRVKLVSYGFGFRSLFWITGILSFFISPIVDNLTTALLMCAVVLAVGGNNRRFVSIACINIVVAANAGGAFSPFGDITTLMVWQKDVIDFWTFFVLFLPSVVNYLVPAAFMHFAIPNEKPVAGGEVVTMRRGARRIIMLFLATIATAVCFHNFLHLPPVLGMLTGLGYLQFFAYYLKMTPQRALQSASDADGETGDVVGFDIFRPIANVRNGTPCCFSTAWWPVSAGWVLWATWQWLSDVMYVQWGATAANILGGRIVSHCR